jgi:glutamyl-tRNA reductase
MIHRQEVFLLGINHRMAAVDIREKLAYKPAEALAALPLLKRQPGIQEAAILSTCNRTEIYVVADTSRDLVKKSFFDFLSLSGKEVSDENLCYFFEEEEAAAHLFRVASGMDSMILGEPQILGQVKDAYHLAMQAQSLAGILDRLFNYAFVTGKKVRSQTALCEGAVTVAHAAVELAQKIFGDLATHKTLLIGAGEMSELVASHLQDKGVAALYIANRTFEKAEKLAQRFHGEALPFADILGKLAAVDIVIGATSATEFILTRQNMVKPLLSRPAQPLFLIDISVPRNFDPRINELDNIFVHDIDALKQIVESNLAARREEIPKAEALIAGELQQFVKWHNSLEVAPTIAALREKMEHICETELEKCQSSLNEKEFKKVSTIARSIVNKILHTPTLRLKEYTQQPDGNGVFKVDIVRELFGLGDNSPAHEEAVKKI